MILQFFLKKKLLKVCAVLAKLVLCGAQFGNCAVKIIQMTLDILNTAIFVAICVNLS